MKQSILALAGASLLAFSPTSVLAQTATGAAPAPQMPEKAAAQPVSAVVAAPPVITTLPANISVTFRNDTALASDKRKAAKGEPKLGKGKDHVNNPGDIFYMSVVNDVKSGGVTVVPKGARGTGEVLRVSNRGGFGKSGTIEVAMRSLEVGGKQYKMQGTQIQKGKGRAGAAVAGVIIAGVIAGVFIKGDEADLPIGAEMTFQTAEPISSSQ